jgi:catechol 2,3-dioxygenase-like lactoylglutathione lyase family enzyme
MALSLNHYSIRTTDLDACRHFYETVLGLTIGPRPEFPFPGLWMYTGSHDQFANAAVHIIGIDHNAPQGLDNYLGERDESVAHGTGTIDHVAFFADGLMAMTKHLRGLGIAFRERAVPGIGLYQLFLDDPNGVVIELNYPAAEGAAMLAAGTQA